eukprot:CAMPEP_0170167820 /NCGR_PEP_ID=MMETSP0040_2-20121228/1111_1 /TAXON_ID=641309 /ORGANISM="Lotharella oceanica, Strain CCMP622" /LENGTH=141 /DNA_ID=CAMNT_0010405951 /DNA_START=282 /DNA_END=707 /DNA_ORIENTATION=-
MILRCYKEDGSPVTLKLAEAFLQDWKKKTQNSLPDIQSYLISQEHPVDGIPVFVLKVCQMEGLMSLALSAQGTDKKRSAIDATGDDTKKPTDRFPEQQYGLRHILCWLGIVGPYVGLPTSACSFAGIIGKDATTTAEPNSS